MVADVGNRRKVDAYEAQRLTKHYAKGGESEVTIPFDIAGETFGRLTAVNRTTRNGSSVWRCECTCGNISHVNVSDLRAGKSKSCGCLRKELMTTHGMNSTRFYRTWDNMLSRCGYENSVNYEYYGGRGISVCDEWKDFQTFKDDVYDSYVAHAEIHGESNTTIDRIDVNGNYEKANVAWATMEVQSKNKRIRKNNASGYEGVGWSNHLNKWRARITIEGKEKNLGTFLNIEDAITARKTAETKRDGECS